jgi:signal transduction histidine kinase
MREGTVGLAPAGIGEELGVEAAWKIQLRWFAFIGILEIRLRWLAAFGVLAMTWAASTWLQIPLPTGPLYAIGVGMLVYNALLRLYLARRRLYPIRARSSGYQYDALLRFYWTRLEQEAFSEAVGFNRFLKVQTGIDWLLMILLVHFSGGIESPLLFYFVFHLIFASILLSRRDCYIFATLATLLVTALAILEGYGVLPHVSLGFVSAPLYQSGLYVASVLFFFTTSLYVSVYLTTTVISNLRQKDEELLRLQHRLSDAYQLLQTLYQVTRTISSSLDAQEVLDLVAKGAAEAMEVQGCTIRLVREAGSVVDTVAAYGLSQGYLDKGPIDIQRSRHIQQTFSSAQPVIISDVSRDARLQYAAEAEAEGVRSMLCAPLIVQDKVDGVICVYSAEAAHFDEDDAEFLSALASAGSIAIENARTYEALKKADQAKSDFVQMVTHELRSPLSAVQSMLTLMEEGIVGPVTPKQLDLLQRSERRIGALLALVGDLLELAAGRIEHLEGQRTELLLNDLVTRVVEMMQAHVEEKGLALTVELSDETLTLLGVREALERVLVNLVDNAIKYTPRGGSVWLRAWRAGDRIEIEVTDTGIGIPEEALPRVFDEFYRARNAASAGDGTGLGLTITRDIVEQHGGRIAVRSVVGEGSTFHVSLPAA